MKNPHPDTAMKTHYKIAETDEDDDDNDDDISYFSAGRRNVMQTKTTNSKYPHPLDILSELRMNSSVLDKSIFLTEGPSGK